MSEKKRRDTVGDEITAREETPSAELAPAVGSAAKSKKGRLTKKQIIFTVTAAVLVVALTVTLALVFTLRDSDDGDLPALLQTSDIAYLNEIRDKGNLTFEWLRAYNAEKPTAIIIHGETTGAGSEKFTMNLDASEYTFKTSDSNTEYVVADSIGYKAEGLKLDLSNYWLSVADWNVAVFHWERFADEENPDDILAKLFSVPKMRYSDGNGGYETSRVPKSTLTEVFASLYLAEMQGKTSGREIRFIGNGTGANLALSAAHYLSLYAADGQIDKNYLPSRLALCDPYLSTGDMHIAGGSLSWANISTTGGMLNAANDMLGAVAGYGAAVELVESKEISSRKVPADDGSTVTQNVASYAYDVEMGEKDEQTFKSIKEKVAYLELRESYSVKFSDAYKGYKRIALDWYLYSIIGSDDSNNAGGGAAIGYPRNLSDFHTYYTYSGFNWGGNETRPMMNDRQQNNDSSTTTASSRGKNFAVSAWTPTVYTRALKGISFTMKKYLSKTTKTDVHGNPIFTYSDYTMGYFRSENFQVSDQNDYTLICGYVYRDKNGDGYMNDGYNGVAGALLKVKITSGSGTSVKDVASFDAEADETGFYVIRLDSKTKDSEGNLSKAGYSFDTSHSISLTFVPSSHSYYQIASASSGIYYNTINGHNFTKYAGTVSMTNYYADAVTVFNCLVREDA